VVPLQHPFGHEVALQTQAPPLEQVVPVGQGLHDPPFVPQLCVVGGEWHCRALSQQPPAHDEALQTHMPFEQVCPLAQGAQDAPPTPQVWGPEVWQRPCESQHPFGHEPALQTQAPPLEQVVPVEHGRHMAPFVPQVWIDGGV
jgi:hypothetical protein